MSFDIIDCGLKLKSVRICEGSQTPRKPAFLVELEGLLEEDDDIVVDLADSITDGVCLIKRPGQLNSW